MILGMLWIVSVYGLGIAFVHLAHYYASSYHHRNERTAWNAWRTRYASLQKPVNYTIESFQNECNIEWTIRSLLFSAWLRGESLRITVCDQGSTDDTLDIVRRLSINLAPQTIEIVSASRL